MITIFSIFLIGFFYLSALSNSLLGANSGSLISAVLNKNTAASYQLYTLLSSIFNALPLPFLTPAGKTALLSIFSAIFCFILLYLIIKEIADSQYFNKWLAIAVIFIAGLNYTIWLYSITTEIIALNALIILALFYFAVKFYKTQQKKYLYLIFWILGLGVSHHYSFIFVLPSIIYLFYFKKNQLRLKSKTIVFGLIFLLAGLLPFIYSIYALKTSTDFSLIESLKFIFNNQEGIFTSETFKNILSRNRLILIETLFYFILDDYKLIGIIFFILGLLFFMRLKKSENKPILTAVILNLIFFGPLFFFLNNFLFLINNFFYFYIYEKFLFVFYFFLSVFIYFGLQFAYNLFQKYIIGRYIQKKALKQTASLVVMIIIFLYPAHLFIKNSPVIYSLKNDQTAENLGRDVLMSAEKNSIIILSDNILYSNAQYINSNLNLKQNKNKVLVSLNKLPKNQNFKKLLNLNYPKLKFTNDNKIIQDLILSNKDNFAVYTDNPNPDFLSADKLKQYVFAPQGFLYKLEKNKFNIKQVEKNISLFWSNSANKNLADLVKKNNRQFANLYLTEIIDLYRKAHQNSALFYLISNDLNKALAHIKNAETLDDKDNSYNFFLLAIYYQKTKNCRKAEEAIEKAISIPSSNQDQYKMYLSQRELIKNQCQK